MTEANNDITKEQLDHFLKDFQYLCDQHEIYLEDWDEWSIGFYRSKIKYNIYEDQRGYILDWSWDEKEEETSLPV